jgi:hypothetical protein
LAERTAIAPAFSEQREAAAFDPARDRRLARLVADSAAERAVGPLQRPS